MPRPVSIANRHPRLRLDRRAIARAIQILDAHAERFDPTTPRAPARKSQIQNRKSKIPPGPPPGELSLVFLTDAALATLHAEFLQDPTTTDVITFEGNPALGTAGEICVSADAALRHVSTRLSPPTSHRPLSASRLRAFSAELTLYLVHGWLHLAGYDDLVPAKKRVMRRAEARALELLRRARCLPHFVIQNNS